MLALNVAAETLQAFRLIDNSLMKTFKSFSVKNDAVVRDFERAAEENEGKVGHWRDLAKEVQTKSDSLINYIIELKALVSRTAGAEKLEGELTEEYPFVVDVNNDTLVIKRQDDLNATPEVMLTKGKGAELQQKIQTYRQDMIDIVGDHPAVVASLVGSLSVDDPEKSSGLNKSSEGNYRTWVLQNFESSPCIATVALLSKFQIDVRNAESAVLGHLYSQIDAASFKFTGLEAKVIPNTSYVIQGQKYEAKIFLSAIDNTQDLKVYMNGSSSPLPVQNGEAIYSISPNTPGFFNYKGEIKFTNPDGSPGSRMFSGEYQVAAPNATISPTKMNVLYRNLPNPISISVPGIPTDKLEVSMTNGKISKVENGWVAEPSELDGKGEKTKIIVNANVDGQSRKMLEMGFRVKKVPDPRAQVAGIASGSIPLERLKTQQMVSAVLEDFFFDLTFVVTSFDLSLAGSGGYYTIIPSKSNRLTDEQKKLLNGLRVGDKVNFENIKAKIEGDAKDPERSLSPVIITVQ